MQCSDDFERCLGSFELAKLLEEKALVIGLDRHLRIHLLNDAWERAAHDFGAPEVYKEWTLGRYLPDAMQPREREHTILSLTGVLERGQLLQEEYECNDSQQQRRFGLVVYPLPHQQGLLQVHSLRYATPHGSDPGQDVQRRYAMANGMLARCAGCQRYRDPEHPELWQHTSADAVPHPRRLSHVLCHLCATFFMGSEAGA